MPSIQNDQPGSPSRLRPNGWPREAIARGARGLWERAGYPVGRDDEFWLEAEHRVLGADGVARGPWGAGSAWCSHGGARYLLIVDDQTRFGWTWAAALRRGGFRVSIAANADAGWSTLDEREFALLITSQDSIGRRSLELVGKVRRSSRTMPCVLVRDQVGELHGWFARLLRPGVVVDRSLPVKRLLALVRGLVAASDDPGYVPVSRTWGNTP